jgi:hypothetical protein
VEVIYAYTMLCLNPIIDRYILTVCLVVKRRERSGADPGEYTSFLPPVSLEPEAVRGELP